MQKAKKYDWKDSNMALFGTDTEKQVKKESAESEPAWTGAGQAPGLQIWRIVKFKVEKWPKEDYGDFYEGDSYIILNTYQEPDGDELKYDVHFWIGKYSTQDEYGTAAYKTVELDTLLDDKPIQHREVQKHESALFKGYFKTIQYNRGGADTGFKHVTPEEYTSRLIKVCKTGRKIEKTEVPLKRSVMTSKDVFILDSGLTLYQWNGKDCTNDEKFAAAGEIGEISSKRGGKPERIVLEEDDISGDHPFYEQLTEEDDDDEEDVEPEGDPEMLKISDADGSIGMDPVDGGISQDKLTSDDVYLINTMKQVYVWVGKGASIDERRNGLSYACNYLRDKEYCFLPITVVNDGSENAEFKTNVPECA